MSKHRLLLPIVEDARLVRLEGEPYHHLVHVLRAAPGAKVELFDGHGGSRQAILESIYPTFAQLRVDSVGPKDALPGAHGQQRIRGVSLLQALPKGEKWEWILQKGTELGCAAFRPVLSERTVGKVPSAREGSRLLRWEKIVAEASRQCGRNDVPEVALPQPLDVTLRDVAGKSAFLILDEGEHETTLWKALSDLGSTAMTLTLAIGPEGGWTRAEVEAMRGADGRCVTLGPRVLRTETAALAALAIVLALE